MAVRGVDVRAQAHPGVGERQLHVGHPGGERPAAPSPGSTGHSASAGSARRPVAGAPATARPARGRGCRAPARRGGPASARPELLEQRAGHLERVGERDARAARGRRPSSTTRSASLTASTSASRSSPSRATSAPAWPPRWRSDTTAVRTRRHGVRPLDSELPRVAVLPPQPLRRRLPDLLQGHGARPEPQAGAAPAPERAARQRSSPKRRARRRSGTRVSTRPVRRGRAVRGRARGAAREGSRRPPARRLARRPAREGRSRAWRSSDLPALLGSAAEQGLLARARSRPAPDGERAVGSHGASPGRSGELRDELRVERLDDERLRIARWIMRPNRGWELQEAPVLLPADRFLGALARRGPERRARVRRSGGVATISVCP